MQAIIDNIQSVGPMLAGVWAITIACTIIWPQHYRNSFLLMLSLIVTMVFAAGFFSDDSGYLLLFCFLLIMLGLFLVPILLV
ncbi:MAG: hypothetical protein IJ203_09230, partial [Atopobiaceae bacterium]|nr:hypothetical protein [Atopobiaceae bacterium]